MEVKKAGSHCYSKREEAWLPLLFLNNNEPVFSPCFFQVHILDLIFSGSQTDPRFQNKNSGCRLTGRLDLLGKRPHIIWTISYQNRPLCTAALFLELERRRRRVKELSWFFSSQTWFLASTELLFVVSSHYYVVIEYIYYTSDVSFSLERVIMLSVFKMTDQFIIGIV